MAEEFGHQPGRAYIDQAGNLHLNGASIFDAAEEDITDKLAALGDGFTRDDWVQETAVVHPISVAHLRVHDAFATPSPAAAASDDLGVINNTFGTTAPTVETGDQKAAGAVTLYARFQFAVPEHYVPGQAITLRLNAGMKTTVADTTATLDAECYRVAAPNVDICATAAQSINSLTAANKTFTLTPTNVVVGDLLDIRLALAVNDAATGTAVIGQINSIALLLATKG